MVEVSGRRFGGVLRQIASQTEEVLHAGCAKGLKLLCNTVAGGGKACQVGESGHAAFLHERSDFNRVRLCIPGSTVRDGHERRLLQSQSCNGIAHWFERGILLGWKNLKRNRRFSRCQNILDFHFALSFSMTLQLDNVLKQPLL